MEFDKYKMYIIAGIIVLLIGLYFLQTWYIKKVVHDECKQLLKVKRKKLPKQNMPIEEQHPQEIQQDIDSYIDPGDDENDEPQQPPQPKQGRVSKDDILMRDMIDGSVTRNPSR